MVERKRQPDALVEPLLRAAALRSRDQAQRAEVGYSCGVSDNAASQARLEGRRFRLREDERAQHGG
jgi:hypothetical protein